jgi:hypothetical protein
MGYIVQMAYINLTYILIKASKHAGSKVIIIQLPVKTYLVVFCLISFWAISRNILRRHRLFWPLKISLEMAHKIIFPQKK